MRFIQFLFLLGPASLPFTTPLAAQDELLAVLSVSVCDCLDGNTYRGVAAGCLDSLARNQAKSIRQRYDLDVAVPVQRAYLAELMMDQLLENCPLLKTVRLEEEENEFRWADRRRVTEASVRKFQARKRPPADAPGRITAEPPPVWRASGALLTQPGSKGLRLRTATGEELTFELPAAVARRRDFDPGDEVRLTYRREWRPRERRIVLVVTEIE